MPKSCIVPFCKHRSKVAGIRYFRVGEIKRVSWLIALGRNPNDEISTHSVVCSDHFRPEDYMESGRLKSDAVPTLNIRPEKPSFKVRLESRLPSNPLLREKCLDNIGQGHFEDCSFDRTSQTTRLSATSVPMFYRRPPNQEDNLFNETYHEALHQVKEEHEGRTDSLFNETCHETLHQVKEEDEDSKDSLFSETYHEVLDQVKEQNEGRTVRDKLNVKLDHTYADIVHKDYRKLYLQAIEKLKLARKKIKFLNGKVRTRKMKSERVTKFLKNLKSQALIDAGKFLNERSKQGTSTGKHITPKKIVILL